MILRGRGDRKDGAGSEEFRQGQNALDAYFRRYADDSEKRFAAARYEFHLRKVHPWWGETRYEFDIVPLDGKSENGAKIYRRPSGAIDEVPDEPELAYRGMAWEEWQAIRKRGYIESTGSHNLDQKGLTFCGRAQEAEHYASGFAPLVYKPGHFRPGVVIAFPRRLVLHHSDLPSKIREGECAIKGRLPASEISGVWYLVPTRIKKGYLEVVVDARTGRVDSGSRSSPSVRYAVLEKLSP
jgi:hypothetical protein